MFPLLYDIFERKTFEKGDYLVQNVRILILYTYWRVVILDEIKKRKTNANRVEKIDLKPTY